MVSRREIHERVLNAQNSDELAVAYAEWAENYDRDLTGAMGYRAPLLVASLLHEHITEGARILDAGCGTGLVGVELSRLGAGDIDGLDYSADMLEQARSKAVYLQLTQADLMAPLELTDNAYDAVTCAGTFTLGHVGPGALGELIRVTRSGGHICFTVREEAWSPDEYEHVIDSLVADGAWEPLERRLTPYLEEDGSNCYLCLYRVC